MTVAKKAPAKPGLWSDVRVTGLYTLSPLHVGVGQVAGAVDLPVARDAGSGFPVIPASGLKGAARASLRGRLAEDRIEALFGPDLGNDDTASGLAVGRLTFTEARLLAYPVRSLSRPFFYATCPAILSRWQRDLRIAGSGSGGQESELAAMASGLTVTDGRWANDGPLVLEDIVYDGNEIRPSEALARIAGQLAALLPAAEQYTRDQFQKTLVCLPDSDFADLMARIIPVRARTRLTDGKTTDKWRDPQTGKEQSGNLWYEEYLPADTLFGALVGQRRAGDGGAASGDRDASLADLDAHAEALRLIQIGGNETVGYGLCSWVGWRAPAATGSGG